MTGKYVAVVKCAGEEIAQLTPLQRATFECQGKKFTGDLIVETGVRNVGAIDLSKIPEVNTLENPTDDSITFVKYNGEIYILVEGEQNGV